jgi:hypothetical protein
MPALSDKAFNFLKKTPVKFFATIGEDGYPNVVPLLSTMAWDKDTLCFVRFMIWKTRKNLEDRKKVAVSGLGFLSALEVLGEFVGFEKAGEKLEFFNQQTMYRYNAYFGAGQIGVIKVIEEKGWSKAQPWRMVQARVMPSRNGHASQAEVMPKVVSEKFRRILGAKYIAWIDEKGWPRLAPAPGAFPLSANQIGVTGFEKLFETFEKGKPIALTVLSTEPSSYQVKGKFIGMESASGTSFALIDLDHSFSSAPPLPGEQIYPR